MQLGEENHSIEEETTEEEIEEETTEKEESIESRGEEGIYYFNYYLCLNEKGYPLKQMYAEEIGNRATL